VFVGKQDYFSLNPHWQRFHITHLSSSVSAQPVLF